MTSAITRPALLQRAHDLAAGAQIVVDRAGSLAMANDQARRLLGILPADIGRSIEDLDVCSRPVELRARLHRIETDRVPIVVDGARWQASSGPERVLDVRLSPVVADGELLGVTVIYTDVTALHRVRTDLVDSRLELTETHAELRSTVEELATTSALLRSTATELEMMSEELRSTTGELERLNDELRERTFELDDAGAILESVLTTIGLAIAVLDRRHRVQLWNGQARELWGLDAQEVQGRDISALGIGLPAGELEQLLIACVRDEGRRQEVVLDAVDGHGRPMRCRVACVPLSSTGDATVTGMILLMEPLAG